MMETRSQEAVVWALELNVPGQPARVFSSVGLAWREADWPVPIEPRIIGTPSEFVVQAMTQQPGALPELPQVTLSLHNGDGALTRMLLGASTTAEEFAHPCIVGARAYLWLGVFGPGETPHYDRMRNFGPMYISGPVEIEEHTVRLTLAAVDRLSASHLSLWTAGELADARLIQARIRDSLYSRWWPGTPTELWGWVSQAMRKAPNVTVPVVFGSTLHKAVSLGVDTQPATYIWGIDAMGTAANPSIELPMSRGYTYYDGKFVLADSLYLMGVRVAEFRLEYTDQKGKNRRFWLLCILDIGANTQGMELIDRPLQIWPDVYGFAHQGPADVLRSVADWLDTSSTFDQASIEEVIEMQKDAYDRTVAGVIAAPAPMQSVASQMSLLGDLRYYMTGDQIGVALGDIPQAAIESARTANLPHIRAGDIFPADAIGTPAFRETIPAGPDDSNAALARVIIDWPDDFKLLRPNTTAIDRIESLNDNASPLAELTIPGEWISPWAGEALLDLIAERALFPTRIVEVTTHLSAVMLHVGDYIRVSSTMGLTAEGGSWNRRLCRVEKITALPSDAACRLLLRDLGPLEEMRLGKLDSLANWILHVPTVGSVWKIDTTAGGAGAVIELPYALPGDRADYIDATIWTPGASRESRQLSWRVRGIRQDGGKWFADVSAADPLVNDGPEVLTITVTTGDRLRCEVLVMRTHMQAGAGFRPDYVRGAAPTGFFDGERGYQYTP